MPRSLAVVEVWFDLSAAGLGHHQLDITYECGLASRIPFGWRPVCFLLEPLTFVYQHDAVHIVQGKCYHKFPVLSLDCSVDADQYLGKDFNLFV